MNTDTPGVSEQHDVHARSRACIYTSSSRVRIDPQKRRRRDKILFDRSSSHASQIAIESAVSRSPGRTCGDTRSPYPHIPAESVAIRKPGGIGIVDRAWRREVSPCRQSDFPENYKGLFPTPPPLPSPILLQSRSSFFLLSFGGRDGDGGGRGGGGTSNWLINVCAPSTGVARSFEPRRIDEDDYNGVR